MGRSWGGGLGLGGGRGLESADSDGPSGWEWQWQWQQPYRETATEGERARERQTALHHACMHVLEGRLWSPGKSTGALQDFFFFWGCRWCLSA